MSDLKVNNITSASGSHGTVVAGVSTVSSNAFIIMPSSSVEVRGAGSGRAVFGGGYTAAPSGHNHTMDFVTIASTGNATDFGTLKEQRYNISACASATRGLFAGGQGSPGSLFNIIEFVTISSGGGANDFGDLSTKGSTLGKVQSVAAASNDTRGLFMAGHSPDTHGSDNGRMNKIQFVNIASTGNSEDFGETTVFAQASQACSSPVRAVRAGGQGNPTLHRVIDYVNIASTGNAIKFGETTATFGYFPATASSGVRGLFAGGSNPSNVDTIEYITIASEGNGVDFGDLSSARKGSAGASNKTRGLFAAGHAPASISTIEYVTITTTGNSQDFGDVTLARGYLGGCSDVHGGLG